MLVVVNLSLAIFCVMFHHVVTESDEMNVVGERCCDKVCVFRNVEVSVFVFFTSSTAFVFRIC